MIKDVFKPELYKTDKFTGHSYLETYEQILGPRKLTAKNILEVGVSAGGSILLWRDYFINSQVYGVDIEPMPADLVNDSKERITFIQGNAYDVNFMHSHFTNKGLKFDILIDDGPHTLESFIFFARYYSSLLAPGGVLIIEDIPEFNSPARAMEALPEHLKSKARLVNLRHIQNRWDDMLVVVES